MKRWLRWVTKGVRKRVSKEKKEREERRRRSLHGTIHYY